MGGGIRLADYGLSSGDGGMCWRLRWRTISGEMIERGRAVGEMDGDPTPSDDLARADDVARADDLAAADEAAAFQRALLEALAAIEGIREPLDALGAEPDDVEADG